MCQVVDWNRLWAEKDDNIYFLQSSIILLVEESADIH